MQQLLSYVRGFSFGRMTYPNGGRFGPIERPYLSVLTVEDGCCVMHADGQTVEINAGQTGVAFARTMFRFDYAQGVSTTAIWCEGYLPDVDMPETEFTVAPVSVVATSKRVQGLQDMGVELGLDSNQRINALRDGLGQAVCRAFLLDAQVSSSGTTLPKAIAAARDYMKENLGNEHLSVELIAQKFGMTPQYFVGLFRSHIGMTPSRFLWYMRARFARQLLIHSSLSQTEIAYRCGYKSMPHFSRQIKHLFGMTPGALRKDMGFTQPSDQEDSVEDILF